MLHLLYPTHITHSNETSPTERAGMLNSGTDSGLTKKCPRGPDRRRSDVDAEFDVAHDAELCPLPGLP